MDITQEKIGDLNTLLKVVVGPEDYHTPYERNIKDYAKRVNMPGFRPGKVPVGLIRSKYGKSILLEEIERLVSEKLQTYITENKLDLIGGIMPSEDKPVQGNWNNPGLFEFFYEIGLKPELDVDIDGKDKLTYYTIKIEEEDIDKEINRIGRRYGKLSDAETIGENDMAMGDFVELDQNDDVVPGGVMHRNTISLEYTDDSVANNLIGLKVGESVVLDPRKVADSDQDLARLLGIETDAAAEVNTHYKFIVREIKRLEPAERNQEFFDKVFGEGEVKDEAEFREKIAEGLRGHFRTESDNLFRRDLMFHLIEKYRPELPDEFLKKWLANSDQKDLDPDADYPEYRRSTQWQLMVNNLLESKKVELKNQEVFEHTKDLLRKQYAQYGIENPEEEQLEQSAKQVLANQDEANKISSMLVNEKLVEYAKANAKLTEKEVEFTKFAELAAEDPAEKTLA